MAALKRIFLKRRSMGKRLACMSSVSPVVELRAPVTAFATLHCMECSLLVITTEPFSLPTPVGL